MRKKFSIDSAALAPLLVLLILAWSSESRAQEPLKVRLALRTGAQYAPFYVGKEKGFFKAEGIDLEFLVMRTSIAIIAITNGEIDFMSPLGSALRATLKGFPLKVLFVLQSKPPWSIFVRPEIRSVNDLPGKLIGGAEVESSKTVATRMALQKKGIDVAKITFRFIAGDQAQYAALRANQLDGAVLSSPFAEMARRDGYRELLWLGEVVDLPLNGLVATESKIRKNPELVRRTVRATQNSLKYVMDHPEEMAVWVKRAYGLEDKSLAQEGVTSTLRTFNVAGTYPVDKLFAETLYLTPASKLPPLEQAADFSFAEKTAGVKSK